MIYFLNYTTADRLAPIYCLLCLENLNNYLAQYSRDLNDYGIIFLRSSEGEVFHELSRWYPVLGDLAEQAEAAKSTMTREQLRLFRKVIQAIDNKRPLCVFVDGKAGTGKTHVIKAICSYLRSQQKIVIATASSAFAAQLYDGGRTAHSAFKVRPILISTMLDSIQLKRFLWIQVMIYSSLK